MTGTNKNSPVAPTLSNDPWRLVEEGFDAPALAVSETLFAQANGYLGTRGTFGDPVAPGIASVEGTYLNGVYVRDPIHYDEGAFGFATHNDKMILVPDAKLFRLTAGGETFEQGKSDITAQERSLDMRDGVLDRTSEWRLASGERLMITSRRFVSLAVPGIMAIEYKVTSLDYNGPLSLETGLDANYGAAEKGTDPRAGHLSVGNCLEHPVAEVDGQTLTLCSHIKDSDRMIVAACLLDVCGPEGPEAANLIAPETMGPGADKAFWGWVYETPIAAGDTLTFTKYSHYGDGPAGMHQSLLSSGIEHLAAAAKHGFDGLLAAHKPSLDAFWAAADIDISGAPDALQGMRFNMYHLFQSAGRDGRRAVAAKGLTGPGYDGHYFWDTEIYAIPFFVFTAPKIARALLEYRIGKLDEARVRAREMAHSRGALFPWRTIGGAECSSFFPAGTAQYHINAAIAYALMQYVRATDDTSLLLEGGAELLFETARLWMDLGHFNPRKQNQFCIHEVTGPDEYTAMVDNNLYTNAMAQHHLRTAAEVARQLGANWPQAYQQIEAKTGLSDTEVADWKRAADTMYLPYDTALGIHEQHDGFLDKPEWDFGGTPPEKYPLLLHYHPLVIYRHQVLKQADVVLAQILLPDQFDAGDKNRNLAYYEPRTTHDSTLSACIYSVASAEAGNLDKAYDYFEETYRMDLENRHANSHYGVHIACMAGSWMALTYGFAGMRFTSSGLSFSPSLPKGWDGYRFQVCLKGRKIAVSIDPNGTRYELISGGALEIHHRQQAVVLTPGAPMDV